MVWCSDPSKALQLNNCREYFKNPFKTYILAPRRQNCGSTVEPNRSFPKRKVRYLGERTERHAMTESSFFQRAMVKKCEPKH